MKIRCGHLFAFKGIVLPKLNPPTPLFLNLVVSYLEKSLKEILKRLRTWGDGERMLVQGV